MTYASPVEVCNTALLRIGGSRITDLNEQTKPALVAKSAYDGIVEDALARFDWPFARKVVQPTYQGQVQGQRFSRAYTLPADVFGIIAVRSGGQVVPHALVDGRILSDHEDLTVECAYRAPEQSWSPPFSEAIVILMRAVFYRALREDEASAERTQIEGERKLAIAAARARRQSSGQPMRQQRYQRVWRGATVR